MLSTAPILALVLVMVSTRPPRIAATFLLGWTLAILAVAGLFVGVVDLSVRPRLPATAGAIVRIALGALVGALAVRSWRDRRTAGDEPPMLVASISRWSGSRALAVGLAVGALNPKNLALVASGATAILSSATTVRDHAVGVTVFAIVASVGVAAPIVLRSLGGQAITRGLERAAQWMTTYGKAISAVVLAIIAVVLISNGVRLWSGA